MRNGETTSDLLNQSVPEIMRRWEARATGEIAATAGKAPFVIRNALPRFLSSVAILLSTNERTSLQIEIDAADILEIAKEHGRGRAGLIPYVMSQVISEYHILREIVFEVLEEKTSIPEMDRDTIISAIEAATNTAATEFALVLSEIQDQFMAAIAHDLKTPITAAQMEAELIHCAKRPDLSAALADRLVGQMHYMTDMIEKILDASRIRAGEKLSIPLEKCDLEGTVRDVVSDEKLIYGDWFVIISDGPVIGIWNSEYLRRVIENLTDNAAKFRSPKTPVTITIRQNEETAMIEVHNLGNPISPDNQRHLFNAFRRIKTSENHKGWGLGLALVKGIVDSFHGSVGVESTKENGTTFTVILPKKTKTSQPVRMTG